MGGIRVEDLICTQFVACGVGILVYMRVCSKSCLQRRITRGVTLEKSNARKAFEGGRGSTHMVRKADRIKPLPGW